MSNSPVGTQAVLFEIIRMQFKLAEAIAISNQRLENLEAAALALMENPKPQVLVGGDFHKLFQKTCADGVDQALSLQRGIQEQVQAVLDTLEGEING